MLCKFTFANTFIPFCWKVCWTFGKITGNISYNQWTLHKKWSFLLEIFSVNVTKSAGNYGFCHIYWKKSLIENFIFCAVGIDVCPQGLHTDAKLFADDTSLFSVVHGNDESASFPF